MPLWKNTDAAANSVIWAAAQFKTTANTANRATLYNNVTEDAIMPDIKVGQFAADPAETAAEAAITHAGWVIRTEGTGGRAGRVQYETLVAMGSMVNDAEDTILKDVKISYVTHPASQTLAAGAPGTFTVSVASVPAGATITYQWQANTGAGYSNLTNAGVYTGATAATLNISDVTGLTGVQYRALALSAGANTITSKVAVLTVTA